MTQQQTPRTKAEWRERARANRDGLTIEHGRVVAGIRHFLTTLDPASGRNVVVTYSALPGEPDLVALAPLDPRWKLALTRTPDASTDRALTIHPIDQAGPENGQLERHRLGYLQPTADAPVLADEAVAVVLVPGLAFAMDGSRLGHGAGYYDRLLARLGDGVVRVGVTDGFIVGGLPTDAHDVPMTHLASEAGVFRCG